MTDSHEQSVAVEAGDDIAGLDPDKLPNAENLDLDQLGPLIEQAASALESIQETQGTDTQRLRRLLRLVSLIQGVLETNDADELLETVDLDEIESVVDLESLPDALESGELGDAVELENLHRLIRFGQLWDAVDLTELVGSKDEISETVSELTGGEGDELIGELDMEAVGGGKDGELAEGLTDPELLQAATQAQLDGAIDGFQERLVETHARLEELRAANQRRFDGVDQPSSRNPTAVSTLTTHRGPPNDASRASTVPRTVRHSSGPSRRRIYGRRFERLVANERGGEENGDEPEIEAETNAETTAEGGENR